jgi:ABC-type nitrate/sulfonate/bicarbonate transport system ATPase subunit
MFSQAISSVQNAGIYLFTNHGLKISWALSFFLNRLVTRTSEESYKQSAAMAVAVSTVSILDVLLRDRDYVSTNAITYGTLTASYVFPLSRQYLSNKAIIDFEICDGVLPAILRPVPLIWTISSGFIVGVIVNQGYIKQSITPSVTGYVNYKINGGVVPPVAISVVDEVFIHYNFTDRHYLSSLSLHLAVSKYFLPQNQYAIFIASGLSVVAAHYEEQILEFFLPIQSSKETYQLLSESTNNNTQVVDRLLETNLVISANFQLSSGVLLLQSLSMTNQWLSFLKDACVDKNKFPDFLKFAIKAMIFEAAKIIGHELPSKPINSYISTTTKKFFQGQFFENKIYNATNFIMLSGKNYTAETYSKDISLVIHTHMDIFKSIVFYLPSLISLTSFGNKVLLIPAIAVVDGAFIYCLNVLQTSIQSFNDEQIEAFNIIGIQEKHDVENANLLVHNDALQYMENQWQDNIDKGSVARLNVAIITNLYDSFSQLYWEVAIWGGTPIFVLYLACKDVIAANQVLESVMAIKNSIETILIKSKKKLELDIANISIKRLQDFFVASQQQRKLSDFVSVSYNTNANFLEIVDLTYVRGNDNSNVTVNIPWLKLELGKKYVVTGENGWGKSSFLLLLNLLQKSFDDRSFLSVSGSVTYPSNDVVIVTQKEYCPLYSDLFSWLVYPSVSKGNSTADYYSSRIISLLSDLDFSSKNLTALEAEFHNVDKDWCSKLSGGQIKKIQMMQSVFLPENCPKILFLDETMGPLDPESKVKMQKKLSEHCKDSLILAVYHYDSVSLSKGDVPFFDYNLHFANGTVLEKTLSGVDNHGDNEDLLF